MQSVCLPPAGHHRIRAQNPTLLFLLFSSICLCLLPGHSQAFEESELIPIRQIATIGAKEGKARLRQPSSVLVARNGNIFVLDGTVNRVVVFSPNGKFLYDFGRKFLDMPLGMTMDNKGTLYVTDTRKGRIQLFSPQGKHLRQIELPKGRNGAPSEPVDVAVDNRRRLLYIVDNRNHRILIHDLKKNRIFKTMGKMGMAAGELRWPFSITLDGHGQAYLVDVINTTVRTINPAENWAFGYDIGGWGIRKGKFFRPKGIAIGTGERLFVSDSYLGVVQLFDKEGHFIAVLSDANKKIHRFKTPVRLFIDNKNRLYVVEMVANRISVFEIQR